MRTTSLLLALTLLAAPLLVAPVEADDVVCDPILCVQPPCDGLSRLCDVECDPNTLECEVPSPCMTHDCTPDPCEQGVCEPLPDRPVVDPRPWIKPRPCLNPIGVVYIADDVDNFGSLAPSSPGAALQAWMNTLPNGQRGFDQWGSNRRFGHTFTGLPSNIVAAKLEIHLHSTNDIPENDGISLQMLAPGVFEWGGGIDAEATLQGQPQWPTTASDPHDDVTLAFDLGVPGRDLRASMSGTGALDVYVQDDTVIDYITLEVWWCECDAISTIQTQGTVDSFVGPEATTPRAGLPASTRVYDQGGADLHFATTLKLPGFRCLKSGYVEIGTRVENQLVSTDWISLQYTSGGFLHSQPAPTGPNGFSTIVTIPLTTALLQDMEANGYFDVFVQDDTAIDFVRLVLTYSP